MTDGNLWTQAMEAVGGIVDIANRHGPRGVDLHFMHQEGFAENMHVSTISDIVLFVRILLIRSGISLEMTSKGCSMGSSPMVGVIFPCHNSHVANPSQATTLQRARDSPSSSNTTCLYSRPGHPRMNQSLSL